MARRTRTTENTESTNEAQEAPVSTVTEAPEATEAVEAPVEAAEAAETPAEVEVDLTAFEAAVATALAEKDSATGEIAPAFIDPVNAEYRKLDGIKAKNRAKAWLNEQMKEAMNELDIQTARGYLSLSENLSASGGSTSSTPKAPADPTQAFVDRYAGLRLGLELVGSSIPEGVAEDWADKAKALYDESLESAKSYLAWLQSDAEDKGDEPEVTAVVKAAVKLSQGKAAKVGSTRSAASTYTGERRDIGKHIAEAFADQPAGTFLTVAEIRKFRSEEYGDNPPSAGAISARLFPTSGKSTVEGVEPGTNDKGHKGATKVA